MLLKTKKAIEKFVWYVMPRVYVCRDVLLIKWMDNEYLVPRVNK